MALLGAVLLGAGYYIAVTITSPLEALLFFFVAVILVILGTYLLFITGITALLKLLKKNKNFYYKTKHFTTISGMLFRMKQNAAGLASICVLFTALLVTVSTTFSLYTSMDELLRARYPRNVLVTAWTADDSAKDLVRDTVAQQAQKLGVQVENVIDRESWNLTVARKDNTFSTDGAYSSTYAVVQAFTLEEFQRFPDKIWNLRKTRCCSTIPEAPSPKATPWQSMELSFPLCLPPIPFRMPPPWPRFTRNTIWW